MRTIVHKYSVDFISVIAQQWLNSVIIFLIFFVVAADDCSSTVMILVAVMDGRTKTKRENLNYVFNVRNHPFLCAINQVVVTSER